jgi:hypothetical protein
MTIFTLAIVIAVAIFNSALFAFLFFYIRRHARREEPMQA